MHCAIAEGDVGAVWPALRELRRFLADPAAADAEQVQLVESAGGWQLAPPGTRGAALAIPLRAPQLPRLDAFPAAVAAALRLYLPVLLGAFRAARAGQPFVTAHVAQSLDGRIACANGHSQWISNDANLRHAHRLRALHDAVLVGSGTVRSDDPQLTVRHVEGEQPRRVVLNGSGSLLAGTPRWRLLAPPGAWFVCSERARPPAVPAGAELLLLPERRGELPPHEVLAALAARGLRSVFLEGGAHTQSSFLTAGCIDLLHVHVAPLLLGSGISSFTLPEITAVQQARRFDPEHFDLDGELLIACRQVPA